MKYLVVGDANSMHIFNFVKTVLLPRKYEVHLLTLSVKPIKDEFRSFYRENGVTVHSIAEKNYKNLNKTDIFHRVLNLLRKHRLMKKMPQIDICHIHSVYKTSVDMVLKNKKKFGKIICSYWGGDIEDRSEYVVNLRKKCFDIADSITVTVKQTYNEFRELYGDVYDSKLQICRFATGGLDCINTLSKSTTRQACRNEYGISEDKICITCGYSAYADQHQDKCLKAIIALPQEIKDKLHVIVPMQYGKYEPDYVARIEELSRTEGLKCDILRTYVPFEKSAMLAIATDIYLHVRDTDAFSNALKEHIYSSSQVITGTWLKYPELVEMGAKYESINSFYELNDVLYRKIRTTKISDKIELFAPIYELYSTESIIGQWSGVIDSVIGIGKEKNEK
ncbi:MAG: hypothetical protein IJ039_09150 [Clostridia bacterium]|nr:hypothetical protein [Clostridia bacterium]